MFQQGLSFVLKKFLHDFIEDGDKLHEKVHVGAWSGSIVLEDLVLKSSILNLVDLPISLSYGYIGRLEIHIPWTQLGVEPVTVIVERIYVLLEPKKEWNPGAADRREQAIKQAKLAAAELFAAQRLTDQQQSSGSSYTGLAKNWFMSVLLSKIINNFQITVREVHVRYEDRMYCPTSYCVGVSFESLLVQTREPGNPYEEEFSSKNNQQLADDNARNYDKELKISGSDSFFKLIELNHLAVYWNPLHTHSLDIASCTFVGRMSKEVTSLMSRTTAMRSYQYFDKPKHHYILYPVDMKVFLDVALNLSSGDVKAKVKLYIPDISIQLEDNQLREIISLSINMANFAKLERFSEYRPKQSVFKDPKAWWRYVINAVLIEMRMENRRKLTIYSFNRRIHDKLVYIELWKSRMVSNTTIINQLNTAITNSLTNTITQDMNTPFYGTNTLQRQKDELYQMILKTARKQALEKRGVVHKPDSKYSVKLDMKDINTNTSTSSLNNSTTNTVIKPLDTDRIALLIALERELTFEDIIYFRILAEKNMPVETRQESWLTTIYSYVSGAPSSNNPSNGSSTSNKSIFNISNLTNTNGVSGSGGVGSFSSLEEERKKLLSAIQFDSEKLFRAGKSVANLNEVTAIIDVLMKQGSVTLALSPPQLHTNNMNNNTSNSSSSSSSVNSHKSTSLNDSFPIIPSSSLQAIPFLQLKLQELRSKTILLGDGSRLKIMLSLQDFDGYELLPSENKVSKKLQSEMVYQKFIFRRALKVMSSSSMSSANKGGNTFTTESSSRMSENNFNDDQRSNISSSTKLRSTNLYASNANLNLPPLLQVNIEIFPTTNNNNPTTSNNNQMYYNNTNIHTNDVEVVVKLNLEELECWISPTARWLDSVILFAAWPEEVIYWSEMEMKAMNQLADMKARVNAKLNYIMNNHPNIVIEGTINAPVIVLHDQRGRSAGRVTVLVVDLGVITISTERLAKSYSNSNNAWKEDMYNTHSVNNSTLTNPNNSTLTVNNVNNNNNNNNTANWEVLPTNDNNPQSLLETQTNFTLEHQMTNIDTLTQHTNNNNNNNNNTSNNNPTDDEQHLEDLFDVFHCSITNTEVYFLETLVSIAPDSGRWHVQYDAEKHQLINKFAITIEIHVSALPWDITLPPVKLAIDINNISIVLSDTKILKIVQFIQQMVVDSKRVYESNEKTLMKINQAWKKQTTTTNTSASGYYDSYYSVYNSKHNQHNSFNIKKKRRDSISSQQSNPTITTRRRSRTYSEGGVSVVSNHLEYDFSDALTDQHPNSILDGSELVSSIYIPSSTTNTVRKDIDFGEQSIIVDSEKQQQPIGASTSAKKSLRFTDADDDDSSSSDDDDDSDENSVGSDDSDTSFFSIDNTNKDDEKEFTSSKSYHTSSNKEKSTIATVNTPTNTNIDQINSSIEELQYIISQRENMKTKLISDIRLTELSDIPKNKLLKQELSYCEIELHQLKIQYVELLMKQDHYYQNQDQKEGQDDITELYSPTSKRTNYSNETPTHDREKIKEHVENILLTPHTNIRSNHVSNVNHQSLNKSTTTLHESMNKKRDLLHASAFKLPPNHDGNDPNTTHGGDDELINTTQHPLFTFDMSNDNKELLYMRVMVHQLVVDIASDTSNTSTTTTATATATAASTEGMMCRLVLSGIGMKVRHRAKDSKISFQLKEIYFSEYLLIHTTQQNNPPQQQQSQSLPGTSNNRYRAYSNISTSSNPTNNNNNIQQLFNKEIPLITSDSSYLNNTNSFYQNQQQNNNNTDFIKLKYEIHYKQERIDECIYKALFTHHVKCLIHVLVVNADQERLATLIVWTDQLIKNIQQELNVTDSATISTTTPAVSPTTTTTTAPIVAPNVPPIVNNNSKLLSDFPQCNLSLKLDYFCFNIYTGRQALISATLSSASTQIKSSHDQVLLYSKLVDFSVFDLLHHYYNNSSPTSSSNNNSNSNRLSNRNNNNTDLSLVSSNLIFGRHTIDKRPLIYTEIKLLKTNTHATNSYSTATNTSFDFSGPLSSAWKEHLLVKFTMRIAPTILLVYSPFVISCIQEIANGPCAKAIQSIMKQSNSTESSQPSTENETVTETVVSNTSTSDVNNLNNTYLLSLLEIMEVDSNLTIGTFTLSVPLLTGSNEYITTSLKVQSIEWKTHVECCNYNHHNPSSSSSHAFNNINVHNRSYYNIHTPTAAAMNNNNNNNNNNNTNNSNTASKFINKQQLLEILSELAINNISLSCMDSVVVENIDILTGVRGLIHSNKLFPSLDISSGSNQHQDIFYPLTKELFLNRLYRPHTWTTIDCNEVQVMIAVSPIRFLISALTIQRIIQYQQVLMSFIDEVTTLTSQNQSSNAANNDSTPGITINDIKLNPSDTNVNDSNQHIQALQQMIRPIQDCKLTITNKVYDISIVFINDQNNTTDFHISVKNSLILLNIIPEHLYTAPMTSNPIDVNSSTISMVTSDQNIVNVEFSIESLTIEDCVLNNTILNLNMSPTMSNTNNNNYKQLYLLSAGMIHILNNNNNNSNSSSSNYMNNIFNNSSYNLNTHTSNTSYPHEGQPFIMIEYICTNTFDHKVYISIDHIYYCFIGESIIRLITLINNATANKPNTTNQPNKHHKSNNTYAYPSSVPMSTLQPTNQHDKSNTDNTYPTPTLLTIIPFATKTLAMIHTFLRSIEVTIIQKELVLVLPTTSSLVSIPYQNTIQCQLGISLTVNLSSQELLQFIEYIQLNNNNNASALVVSILTIDISHVDIEISIHKTLPSPLIKQRIIDKHSHNQSNINSSESNMISSLVKLQSHAKMMIGYTHTPTQSLTTLSSVGTLWRLRDISSNFHLFMKLEYIITTCDILCNIDYRPYLVIYSSVLQPFINSLQRVMKTTSTTTSTTSKGMKATDKVNDIPPINDDTVIYIQDPIQLFTHLIDMIIIDITLSCDNSITLTCINDFLVQPVTFLKVDIQDIELTVHKPLPDRVSTLVLLTAINDNIVGNSLTSVGISTIKPHKLVTSKAPTLEYDKCVNIVFSMNTSVNYLNRKLLAMEPLLEPCQLTVKVDIPITNNIPLMDGYDHQVPVIYIISDGGSTNNRYDEQDEQLLRQYVHQLSRCPSTTIITNDIDVPTVNTLIHKIDINITSALLETVFHTIHCLDHAQYSTPTATIHDTLTIDHTSLFMSKQNNSGMNVVIRNDTGLPIQYWYNESTSKHTSIVCADCEEAISLPDTTTTTSCISISLEDPHSNHTVSTSSSSSIVSNVIKEINLDVLSGCTPYNLFHQNIVSNKVSNVVIDFYPRDGSKLLVIRSTMKIFNATNMLYIIQLVTTTNTTTSNTSTSVVSQTSQKYDKVKNIFGSQKSPSNGTMVSGNINMKQMLLWEAKLLPGEGVFIPASLCALPDTFIHIQAKPLERYYYVVNESTSTVDDYVATFPTPIFGSSNANASSSAKRYKYKRVDPINGFTYMHYLDMNTNKDNASGTVTELSRRIFTNIQVESRGLPTRPTDRTLPYSCHIRNITILPPVTILNLLACDVIVKVIPQCKSSAPDDRQVEVLSKYDLSSGETIDCHTVSAEETFQIEVCLQHDVSSNSLKLWSVPLTIPITVTAADPSLESESSSSSNTKATADKEVFQLAIAYKNQSILYVNVEVSFNEGSRILTIYTPYWLITSSYLTLHYQHDQSLSAVQKLQLNGGLDGLLADQEFDEMRLKQANNSSQGATRPFHNMGGMYFPRGIGKARGTQGIILGPDSPLKGLADVLYANTNTNNGTGRVKCVSALETSKVKKQQRQQQQQQQSIRGGESSNNSNIEGSSVQSRTVTWNPYTLPSNTNHLMINPHGSSTTSNDNHALYSVTSGHTNTMSTYSHTNHNSSPTNSSGIAGSNDHSLNNLVSIEDINYHIVHCNYSNIEKKLLKLRLKQNNTEWSQYFTPSLSTAGYIDITLTNSNDHKLLTFTLYTQVLPAPYHRSQAVYITDKYVVLNNISHTVELRQSLPLLPSSSSVQSEVTNDSNQSMFIIRTHEECPLSFASTSTVNSSNISTSPLHFQVRLARSGWRWSGEFNINTNSSSTSQSNEIPLRLRNEHDNTVYFIMVFISTNSSTGKVTIVLKGGEVLAPYRIENYTEKNFQLCQTTTNETKLYTSLLPYHTTAYAWDEPLQPHTFEISVLSNASHAQDRWQQMGVYTFDKLGHIQRSTTNSTNNGLSSNYQHLVLLVIAQGTVRVLQIYDNRYPSIQRSLPTIMNTVKVNINLIINSLGVSVVDHTPEELLYFNIRSIEVSSKLLDKQAIMDVSIQHLQLDNQLQSASYTRILQPLTLNTINNNNNNNIAKKYYFINVNMKQDFEYSGILFLPSLQIDIAPFDINLEGTIILKLVDMALKCVDSNAMAAMTNIAITNTNTLNNTLPSNKATVRVIYPQQSRYMTASNNPNSSGSSSMIMIINALAYSPHARANNNSSISISNKLTTSQVQRIYLNIDKIRSKRLNINSNTNTKQITNKGKQQHISYIPNSILSQYLVSTYLHSLRSFDETVTISTKIYFQDFKLSEIKCNLSFNPTMHEETLQQALLLISNNLKITHPLGRLLSNFLQRVFLGIGSSVVKVNNCPLRFVEVTFKQVFTSQQVFVQLIGNNYLMQFVQQIHVILLSSDLLGNPTQLGLTLYEGLNDLIAGMKTGMKESTLGFVLGTLRGTRSLVKSVVAGSCSVASHLTASLQVGLANSGFVESYSKNNNDSSNSSGRLLITDGSNDNNDSNNSNALITYNKPTASLNTSSSSKKLSTLPKSFSHSISLALNGLFSDPIAGYRAEGLSGLLFGSLHGGIGLFARPLFGLLGDVSITLDMMSYNIQPRLRESQKQHLSRIRPPRTFTLPVLQVYSGGRELLSRIGNGEYTNEECLFHKNITADEKKVVILTKQRILVVDDVFDSVEVKMQCMVKNITRIELENTQTAAAVIEDLLATFDSSNNNNSTRTKKTLSSSEQPCIDIFYDNTDNKPNNITTMNPVPNMSNYPIQFYNYETLLLFFSQLIELSPYLFDGLPLNIKSYLIKLTDSMQDIEQLTSLSKYHQYSAQSKVMLKERAEKFSQQIKTLAGRGQGHPYQRSKIRTLDNVKLLQQHTTATNSDVASISSTSTNNNNNNNNTHNKNKHSTASKLRKRLSRTSTYSTSSTSLSNISTSETNAINTEHSIHSIIHNHDDSLIIDGSEFNNGHEVDIDLDGQDGGHGLVLSSDEESSIPDIDEDIKDLI